MIDEEEIGSVPAPPMAPQGGSGRPPGRRPSWRSFAGYLGVLLAVTGAAGTAGVVSTVVGGSSSRAPTSNASPRETTESPTQTEHANHPARTGSEATSEATYLDELQLSAGDVPLTLEAELDGHDYRSSLLYELGSYPSQAAVCESRPWCRATSYELRGAFTRFRATLGTESSSDPRVAPGPVLWSVVVDGRPRRQGRLTQHSAPVAIDVPLAGAHDLELRAIAANGGDGTIVWGDARVF